LQESIGFHPLAVDDALEETHLPKLDDWEEYLYLVLRAVVFEKQDSAQVETPELDVFLGKNNITTFVVDLVSVLTELICLMNHLFFRSETPYPTDHIGP
jgi:magnesium transporter